MRDWMVSTLGGGATALAIVIAIIGLAGALGGAATSYLVAQKTVYINAITAERMKWITSLRANIASLISQMTVIQAALLHKDLVKSEAVLSTLKSMNETGKNLELQLNPNGKIDSNMLQLIRQLYKSTNQQGGDRINPLSDKLIAHSQWLLKEEWERVKYEARGPLGKIFSRFGRWIRRRRYTAFCETEAGKI